MNKKIVLSAYRSTGDKPRTYYVAKTVGAISELNKGRFGQSFYYSVYSESEEYIAETQEHFKTLREAQEHLDDYADEHGYTWYYRNEECPWHTLKAGSRVVRIRKYAMLEG